MNHIFMVLHLACLRDAKKIKLVYEVVLFWCQTGKNSEGKAPARYWFCLF